MPVLTPNAEPTGAHARLTGGLLLMSGAMVFLPAMDAVAKAAAAHVSPGQITWARFAFQALFTLPLLVAGEGWRAVVPNRIGMNLLRGCVIALSSCLFFAAIKYMPLADALAIFFVEPFILTLMAPLVEQERLGWRRMTAVAVGFSGALIVIRPSYSVFGAVSLLPLAAAAGFALYLAMSKRFASFDTPRSMQFTAGVGGTLMMTAVLAIGSMVGVNDMVPTLGTPAVWGMLAIVGLFSTVGHLMVTAAFHRAPAGVLAPFQYLEIAGATVYGYLLFGDFPDFWKWVGIAIIVGSGSYVFWRESRSAPGAERLSPAPGTASLAVGRED